MHSKSPTMTFPCKFTRKTLAIVAVLLGVATLAVTVITVSIVVSNKNKWGMTSNGHKDSSIDSTRSLFTDLTGMQCGQDYPNRNTSMTWPLNGPIVPECKGGFSIEQYQDESAFNAAQIEATKSPVGNNAATWAHLVLPTEKEVAQNGHYSGVRPIHYNLSVNILNEQQFDGGVDILLRIVHPTNRIILDVDLDALEVADDEIALRQYCPDEGRIRRPLDLCVLRMVKLRRNQALLIETSVAMRAQERYVLSVGSFRGRPLSRPDDPNQKYKGSVGLRLADKDGESWALTTIFQMRYARTVFPCMDQPAMKARFTVTVERPADTMSASNTAMEHSAPVVGREEERWRDQYKTTPPLAPYVITFSVMRGYTMHSQAGDNNTSTSIQLYYPHTGQRNSPYQWIVEETKEIIGRMEEATGFAYGQNKLGFINVNPAPFWGIENYGLVTLESGFSRYPDIERGHTILVHEIVHQWLGDVVTISTWDEICLQEGLTAYFEWKLSEQLPSVQTTLQLQARRARAENMRKDELNTLPLIRPYNKTDDIAEVCFGKPPLIFHMIADVYGSSVWEIFLGKLLSDHAYGNADFETWITSIAEMTKSNETGQFLRQWFTQPGHPILYVQIDQSDRTRITISQGLVMDGEIVHSPEDTRIVPLKILTQSRLTEAIFVNTSDHVARVDEGAQWVLVDPDSVTFARKVYTVSNYRALLECLPPPNADDARVSPHCAGANRARVHEAFDDFCFGLLKNAFPWGPDRQRFNVTVWTGLFDQLHQATTMASGQRTLQVDRACECCFRTKEELEKEAGMSAWHPLACKRMWNEMCRGLDIMRMTGRNYTAPDRERINEQQRSL